MPLHQPFPLQPDILWQCPESVLIPDFHLKNWLLDTSSLTERLQSHCRHFSVKVLGQDTVPVLPNERSKLDSSEYIVREVILTGDGQPWVFARSCIPKSLCEIGTDTIAELGNKPLGKILFNDLSFKRQPFEVAHLSSDHDLQQLLGLTSRLNLWGRRSAFEYKSWRLLVAEIFLPGCPAYKQMGESYNA